MIDPLYITFGLVLFFGILLHAGAIIRLSQQTYDWTLSLVVAIASTIVFALAAGLSLETGTYWDQGVERFNDPNPDAFFVWIMVYAAVVIVNVLVAWTYKK